MQRGVGLIGAGKHFCVAWLKTTHDPIRTPSMFDTMDACGFYKV